MARHFKRFMAVPLAAVMLLAGAGIGAMAQDAEAAKSVARTRTYTNSREVYREKLNENVLFLMGGQLGAAYIAVAHDISVVVEDGMNLRVLPVVGGAGVQNVHDVVFLRGIDLALTNIQTLNLLKKTGELGPNLDRQVSYIAPLFPEEMQILARAEFHTLSELKGKRVNFNSKGSSTATLAPLIFQELGVPTQAFFMSQPDAIQKMRAGELDATVCMCPKPVPAFAALKPDSNMGLIEVTYAPAIQGSYLPASITHDDYPSLMPKDAKVDTIASSTVLITFNWPKGSQRYQRTAKFVDAFFTKFAELQKPPRHPLWKSVNFAADLPGWQRFPAAQEWLDKRGTAQDEPQRNSAPVQQKQGQVQQPTRMAAADTAHSQFLRERGSDRLPAASTTAAENDRMFREFLEWKKVENR